MKRLLLYFLLACSFSSFSQARYDTIYMNNERVACTVEKVSPEAVFFYYPDETVENSAYINSVQKIVFKSGRQQVFANATSYKTLNSCDDFDNVTFTTVAYEIKGLYKVGEVSSKARGTTKFADEEKVKQRAMRKLKIQAAMLGGNIVLLDQNETKSNGFGGIYSGATTTNMEGVAYCNKLPTMNDFTSFVGDHRSFMSIEQISLNGSDDDMRYTPYTKQVTIKKIYSDGGLIMVDALIEGYDSPDTNYRVVYFSKDEFTIEYQDDANIYNIRIKL